jgi:galactonate dehydratase
LTRPLLQHIRWHLIQVSGKTRWIFVRLTLQDGTAGCGEASLAGQESAVLAAAGRLDARIRAACTAAPGDFAAAEVPSTLAEAAAVSAVDQALWDLHGKRTARTVADLLGGVCRQQIDLYANINRRTELRTPEGFAQSARDALAAGHVAIKLAPFDEVTVARCTAGDGPAAMQAGLARIAAVRAAIGPQRRLMVDCHWRFNETAARAMVRACTEFDLYWIECPLPEVDSQIDALVRLRKQANEQGIRLAGLEQGIRYAAFQPYCDAGAYDVMMPDVKYIGGLQEMLHAADRFARLGIAFSPHNPTGPVCHAASLQLSAAAASFDMLETQFDESPLFRQLIRADFGPVVDGHCGFAQGAGLGVELVEAQLGRHEARVTASAGNSP